MQVETECTRISFGQCGKVWMGIGLFVQRIPTWVIYRENEKVESRETTWANRYTSRLSRPALQRLRLKH